MAGPPGAVFFVVKGTSERFIEEVSWQRTDQTGRFRASALMATTDEPAPDHRGWDPHQPWSAQEAAERASRYWSGSRASVALWQDLIAERTGYLALVVPDRRDGRSVVRYVWTLDPQGTWEDYPMRKFGFPMGEPVGDHPWLGKRLVDRPAQDDEGDQLGWMASDTAVYGTYTVGYPALVRVPVTTRLDPSVVDAIDRCVAAGLGPNRGSIVSAAVRAWLAEHSEEAIIASYRRRYAHNDPAHDDLVAQIAGFSVATCLASDET